MRTLLIAGTALAALFGADAASAGQRMVQHGPGMQGHWNAPRPMPAPMQPRPMPPMGQQHGARWGSKVGGHWWGGVNAPGGWNAYRRPVRGWALPVYWNTPRFYISDWSTYGLAQPQYGYHWVRYYDDAVMVDGRGSVYDTVGDVDWDRYDGYASNDGYADEQVSGGERYAPPPPPPPPPAPAYRDDRYAPPPAPAPAYRDDRRSSGLGGAAVGAVAGGVAGNLIAGRGNRLGGTLIGAGVGAAAGYAIDRSSDRSRRPRPLPDDGYGADYAPPAPAPTYAPPPPRRLPPPPPGHWSSPDGTTTVVTSGGGWGGSVTTVTVQTAPVVTTTTTEIWEDNVTWTRHAKKKWRPHRRVVCTCR